MKQVFYTVAMLVILSTACQPDTKNNRYDNWDANQNSGIDDQEFENAFTTSSYYEQWNDDGNQVVTRDEFAQGFLSVIDRDENDVLSEQEWQQAKDAYFSDVSVDGYQQLSDWDQNGDQQVQLNEFQSILDDLDYYSEWDDDGNGELNELEIAQGVFAMWDTDGNGVIEAEEYEVWDNTP